MNFIRKSLVFLLLFLLVGCSTNLGDEKEDDVNTNEDNVQFPERTDDTGKDTALQCCKCCRQNSENG